MHYSAAHGIAAQHSTLQSAAVLLPTGQRCYLAHALALTRSRTAHMTGKRCDGGGIKFANSCDVIKQHFPCKMCWKSQGSDQPCYVSMMNAPPEKHPGDCMIEGTHTTHACNTAHTAQHSTHSMHTLYAHYTRTTHTTLHYAPPTPHYAHPAHSVLVFAAVVSSALHRPLCSAVLCTAAPALAHRVSPYHVSSYHIIMCVWFGCVCVWFRFGVVESMRWEVHHDLTAMPMRLA